MLIEFRDAEWASVGVQTFFIATAVLRGRRPGRLQAIRIGVVGIGLTVATRVLGLLLPAPVTSVVRDWLPALAMLLVYWQAGALVSAPNPRLQRALAGVDRCLANRIGFVRRFGKLGSLLEFAYLFCYALVPFGVGVLYVLHLERQANQYWMAVLPPTYLCYLLVPFVPTAPPRLAEKVSMERRSAGIRAMNLWILDRASIQANTFPSAHVAASTAASLFILHVNPMIGSCFLVVAAGIAAGAFAGRYHYALDVILGAALSFALSLRLLR